MNRTYLKCNYKSVHTVFCFYINTFPGFPNVIKSDKVFYSIIMSFKNVVSKLFEEILALMVWVKWLLMVTGLGMQLSTEMEFTSVMVP